MGEKRLKNPKKMQKISTTILLKSLLFGFIRVKLTIPITYKGLFGQRKMNILLQVLKG